MTPKLEAPLDAPITPIAPNEAVVVPPSHRFSLTVDAQAILLAALLALAVLAHVLPAVPW